MSLAGAALGGWLAVGNGAGVASLLLTGAAGIVVGLGVGLLSGRAFVVGFLVAFVGGLLLHLRVAGSVAPLWPFALLLGLTLALQLTAGRKQRSGR